MMKSLEVTVEELTGHGVVSRHPLSGGCVGDVSLLKLSDGSSVVAKVGGPGSGLDVEGWMLDYLKIHTHLPAPDVIHADETLLLMTYIASGDGISAAAQIHAGALLADLHDIKAEAFGLERDTVIGDLRQPNPWEAKWLDFFRDHRLLYMAGEALRAGMLPPRLMGRIETLAGKLGQWIEEPTHPGLIHGDVWSGNVLCKGDRVAGFVDPAFYYADPEIELAFTTLFGTFGAPFFEAYQDRRPLRPGFMEERRDLYNLYPLLVHVRLFGGAYVGGVERGLSKFGC